MIKHAAILINGVVCFAPRPGRHHTIIQGLSKLGMKASAFHRQGFIDENGLYYTRERALVHARACGQVTDIIGSVLTSEDLW